MDDNWRTKAEAAFWGEHNMKQNQLALTRKDNENATMPKRAEMCADLARAMGWKVIQTSRGFMPISPEGDAQLNYKTEDFAWATMPDPFAYAADNRALVEWLLSEDSDAQFNEIVFLTELMRNYTYLWQPGKVEFNAVEVRGIIFRVLTAPLETITLAAARALGIPEASE